MPSPGPAEVVVGVRAAGVCLSDAHLIDGSISPAFPVGAVAKTRTVTLGHEVAGVIHAVGPDVARGWKPGTRAVLQAGQACGGCGACPRRTPCRRPLTRGVDYDGGWAECAVAREDTLIALPDDLPFDRAAIISAVRPAQVVGI